MLGWLAGWRDGRGCLVHCTAALKGALAAPTKQLPLSPNSPPPPNCCRLLTSPPPPTPLPALQCPKNCTACTSNAKCTTCLAGFTLTPKSKKCIAPVAAPAPAPAA